MKGWKEEAKWLKAARELNFSVEQRKRVLAARDDALSTLHQCAVLHQDASSWGSCGVKSTNPGVAG